MATFWSSNDYHRARTFGAFSLLYTREVRRYTGRTFGGVARHATRAPLCEGYIHSFRVLGNNNNLRFPLGRSVVRTSCLQI